MPQYNWIKDRLAPATITDAHGVELIDVIACDTETGYVRREQLYGDGVITFGEMRPAPLTVKFDEPLSKPTENPMLTPEDIKEVTWAMMWAYLMGTDREMIDVSCHRT